MLKRGCLSLLLGLILAIPAWPQQQPPDLTEMSLEDLLNIEVTSASKKEQKLSHVAAAIFVITQNDIQHSGATSIPDVLRMVPGVDVAQIDANHWAISIRGSNATYANKVLVMIDGRSVYSDSFSGVFWDQQDVPLEDIDRVEVIRGPGGTVWGANAVNGVINIITKDTRETHGGLISAGGGPRPQPIPCCSMVPRQGREAATAFLATISTSLTPRRREVRAQRMAGMAYMEGSAPIGIFRRQTH
jgi:iron complex outermembrane receptor protein